MHIYIGQDSSKQAVALSRSSRKSLGIPYAGGDDRIGHSNDRICSCTLAFPLEQMHWRTVLASKPYSPPLLG